ncbi:efflux RND transporter periplasmic adaptor subunit [Sulfurimonas sp. MAG313]|nr:efflux RND transporter periplasmic adaptor subunit [Sulfurimonas sp. MAG313]MDF1881330.1 efflux RND transporter periplasmic adaptor subunit [Sulfurimonas sp. MAG313]
MTKIFLLITLLSSALFSVNIPTSHAQKRAFGKSVELNAQVIQLSNAGQSVTSLVSGHLETYFVEPGQRVKVGQKIALIESIMVSKMTADYISLQKQYGALNKNYQATKKLYDNGMTSMQELNNQSIQLNAMSAQINALKSQLHTLGIDTAMLKEATANFILYAHSSGKVSALLQPLHTVVNADAAIITIVKEQAFYIKSFLPLSYASSVKVGQKMSVKYGNRDIITHITQILPQLDATTQRIVVLSSVDEKADDLYINAYVQSTLYFDAKEKYVAVNKSALSFFNNEWVVFVSKAEEHENKKTRSQSDVSGEATHSEHEEHGDGDEHEHGKHEGEDHEEGHADHDEHEKEGHHGEHEEHESPYEARVIEIITQDDKFVAVKGLEVGEEYVSAKSYYVKSMMLKSSLGEHGH